METFDYEEFKKQKKREDFKRMVKEKKDKVVRTISENKEIIIALAPLAVTGIGCLTKKANNNKTQNLKDNYFYDHSTGHYYETKRKLTNRQLLEFDRRKANGERTGEILFSMGLLK